MKQFNLPAPDRSNDIVDAIQKEVIEALDYDVAILKSFVDSNVAKMTSEQRKAYDKIMVMNTRFPSLLSL